MKNDNQIDCSGKPPLKYRVFVLLVIAACLLFWAVHWASVVNLVMPTPTADTLVILEFTCSPHEQGLLSRVAQR
jgi:hypothetical protein